MFGRVVIFIAGGWLSMSAFAWPQSDLARVNTCLGGGLSILYGLVSIFNPTARYLNTAHACLICFLSLSFESDSAACANNVMVAAVIFGASLWSAPRVELGNQGASGAGAGRFWRPTSTAEETAPTDESALAWTTAVSKASRTGRPTRPGGLG